MIQLFIVYVKEVKKFHYFSDLFYSFYQQDNSEVHFKVKMTTSMAKLKKCYSDRQVGNPSGSSSIRQISVKLST